MLDPAVPLLRALNLTVAQLQTHCAADTVRDTPLTLQMHPSHRSLCRDMLIYHISGDELDQS